MKHAIIIGAGVIGCATAYEMAKAGWAVTVVDKAPEAGYGSTSHSSAVIRLNYSVYESCALAYEGWTYWTNWKDYVNLPESCPLAVYKETGSLVITNRDSPDLANITTIMDRLGCRYDRLAADQIGRYLPGADLHGYAPARRLEDEDFGEPTGERIAGAVFFHQAGYVNDPKLAAQNLQWAAEAHGASFRFRACVAGIEIAGGRACGVRLADGQVIRADVVVNVGGPWSSGLNRMAGVTGDMTIRTRANRQEVAYIPGPVNMDFRKEGIVVADLDAEVYMRPDPVGICIGSTDPQCDPHEWVDDPDELDTRFTDQWTTIVMRAAQRLPELRIPGQASGVVAMYDTSDDWLPIYDKTGLPGFYMACGTSGNQFKNAPVVGKIMTHLIAACEAGHDHDMSPLRFQLEHIGHEIDLSAYGRRRVINDRSSFSVMG
ncbi:NAD(P)/FAD-dependent oxidoreductase [Paracoccus siganidrum]|uniref:FAD-binding oxidoreductase n=1 Tax=Paracoccus siganidrum TaxID=1276757 RepID=A0A419ABF4_9RHOB|nr:FAD-dependent oxidoreductase [Paracoccus siganidrum]RJL20779.1 FAD-binding oxidoreductase [Paracoccus siganidrum]RMC31930.1 FAD-binding oxidoreductase [Paracoccus siganidrum]